MFEVELKVRASHAAVRPALDRVGAERRGGVRQVDTYYDAPHRDYAATDEALRLRRETPVETGSPTAESGTAGDAPENADTSPKQADAAPGNADTTPKQADAAPENADAVLTYKGPLVDADSKTREEIELGVAEPSALDDLLRAIGFTPAATVEKVRDRYAVDGYAVSLDDVTDLGEFVEVETTAETDEEIGPARDGVRELVAKLELDPDAGIRASYLGLLLESGT